ncbi:MAG: hypothetical protein U0L19_01485, partial [Bacteroidales bacterium]|nr:hypothetical protein [Bacteroidales bacterium]
ECHLQSKGGTRNRAICRYSFVRYKRYSLTATINLLWVRDFCIEINAKSTQYTGSTDWDEIDWEKYDYND